MSDDSSNDFAEISLMVGSAFAFTNVPRNLLIVSVIISVLGISALTVEPILLDNSDWEEVEAKIIELDVSCCWCDEIGFLGGGCEVSGNYLKYIFLGKLMETLFSWDYILFPPNLSSKVVQIIG